MKTAFKTKLQCIFLGIQGSVALDLSTISLMILERLECNIPSNYTCPRY